MSSSSWTPGWRKRGPATNSTYGKNLAAVAHVENLVARLFISNDLAIAPEGSLLDETSGEVLKEDGPEITVSLVRGQKRFSLILSRLTEAELEGFEQFIKHAIETARPTVRERDKVANEAIENGTAHYDRSYRSAPRVSFFKKS